MGTPEGYKVSEFNLRFGGRHVRKATQVTCPDGRVIRFTEHLPKWLAVREAQREAAKGDRE